MRSIICKKCGSPIDADLGECPLCGAVYYVLPDEKEEIEETRVWDNETMSVVKEIEASLKSEEEPDFSETKVVDMTQLSSGLEKNDKGFEDTFAPKPIEKVSKQTQTPKKIIPPKIEKKWIYIVAATVLLAIVTVLISAMSGAFSFEDEEIEMPQLVGLDKESALAQLKELGITPNTISEPSEEAEDTVIRQAPEDGSIISTDENVTLVFSSGIEETPEPEKEYLIVPDVSGESFEVAKARLEGMGFFVSKTEDVFSETVEEGDVVRQTPLDGAQVEKNGTVTLTVSKGKEILEYNLVLTAGKGGSISPDGNVTVEEGDDLVIEITPDEGYEFVELRIDDVTVEVETVSDIVGDKLEYTITSVEKGYSVYAEFKISAESPPPTTDEPVITGSPTEPEESKRPSSASDIN